jgi:hypothetical protein
MLKPVNVPVPGVVVHHLQAVFGAALVRMVWLYLGVLSPLQNIGLRLQAASNQPQPEGLDRLARDRDARSDEQMEVTRDASTIMA